MAVAIAKAFDSVPHHTASKCPQEAKVAGRALQFTNFFFVRQKIPDDSTQVTRAYHGNDGEHPTGRGTVTFTL